MMKNYHNSILNDYHMNYGDEVHLYLHHMYYVIDNLFWLKEQINLAYFNSDECFCLITSKWVRQCLACMVYVKNALSLKSIEPQ